MFKVKNLVSKKKEVLIFVWLAALTIFLVVRTNNLSGKEGFDNLVTQKRIDVVFDSASSLIGSISKQIYDDEIRINNEIFELQKDVLGLKFPKTVANTERNPYLEQRVNLLEKETKLQNREVARPSEFDIKFSQTFRELEKRAKSLETKLG